MNASDTPTPMPLAFADRWAEMLIDALAPACVVLTVAGSIRRRKQFVKDIEIVAIPKPGEGLFGGEGRAQVWHNTLANDIFGTKIKGEPGDKYLQRLVPIPARLALEIAQHTGNDAPRSTYVTEAKLDLFTAPVAHYAHILTLRTGNSEWNQRVYLKLLEKAGLYSKDGKLWRTKDNAEAPFKTEPELWQALGTPFIQPIDRHV